MSSTKNVAALFGILSVESRLKILLLLKEKRLCVGALSKELGITPGAVSQHLRLLKQIGLVVDTKCANFVHYEINKEALSEALGSLCVLFSEKEAKPASRKILCSAKKCKDN
jgi:DNA-binding transcriptional ArsR family regulator